MIKLKCINDDFSKVKEELIRESNGLPLSFPVKGELYTLRETFDNDGLITSYLLQELYNPVFYIPVIKQRRELSFAEWRFEQVHTDVTVETEIESLQII